MSEPRPLLVVDGYNLLHADDTYRALADRDVELGRRRLVDDVAVFAADRYEAVVVFDGGGPDPSAALGVRVEFSGNGEADTIVESLAFQAREAGRRCLVVTSDRATRDAVLGRGVDAISSAVMLGHLSESEGEWRESRGRSPRVTIADRLDPATRARLQERIDPKRDP